MQKKCVQCSENFEVFERDISLYKKIEIPVPELCPDCRHQRRTAFRNERFLYARKCDMSGKNIVSTFAPDCKAPVYSNENWWSDKWDPLDYGQDFDFNRTFFEQYKALTEKVPLMASIAVFNSQNCDYNTFCVDSKNCYQCQRLGDSEDIYYSYLALYSERCVDCYNVTHSQDCYECIDCGNSNNCKYCQQCRNSSDCIYCYDLIGCHDCFGCVGLRNVSNHFFNKSFSKKEYKEKVKNYFEKINRQKFYDEEVVKRPVKNCIIVNAENVVGNYIFESRNVFQGFEIEKTDGCRYGWGVEFSKDIYDCDFIYNGENCYENISNAGSQNIFFTFVVGDGSHDLFYSMLCFNNTHDCFGCISMKHNEYCILNKKYKKEEYEKLREKVIAHMRKTGEWGKFFPIELSLYPYNETVAHEYFPLTKEEVLSKGWRWRDEDKKQYVPQTYKIPDSIEDVPDSICDEVLACEETGKNYKITPQELKFYRKHNLPIPRFCLDVRHKKRLALRNPRRLWDRKCAKCSQSMKTVYSPLRPEIVYCEKCYLKEVY